MSTRTRLIITIAGALAFACHGEPGELDIFLGTHHPERGSAPETPILRLDQECSDIHESRARVVSEAFAGCSTDADCTLIDGPGCLSAFLCTNAITRGSEEQYMSAAQTEVDDYIQECGNFCSVADCVDPNSLRAACDASTGLCVSNWVQ